MVYLRHKMAIQIQVWYRYYRRTKIIPRLIFNKKNNATKTIQKYLKGYI